MSKTTLGFIFTGLIYLVIGVTLGVLFFIIPETRGLNLVHTHLNLVGFLTFILFGAALALSIYLFVYNMFKTLV